MLDELPLRNRKLKEEEKLLLLTMLKHAPKKIRNQIEHAVVYDMNDGGMGSICFLSLANEEGRLLGETIVEAQYTDIDGIEVLISINIDKRGDLFEIDFWKTDFSPLRQYPKPDQLRFKDKNQ